MSDRRTSRSKKVIDYAKFADDNYDDDDDFANPSPPPTKKRKKEPKAKPKIKNDIKLSDEVADCQRSKKERVPLDDKIYERELQLALEMSAKDTGMPLNSETSQYVVTSSQDSEVGQICGTEITVTADIEPPTLMKENTEPSVMGWSEKENAPIIQPVHKSPGVSNEDTNCIVILENDVDSSTGRRPRRAATKACKSLREENEETSSGRRLKKRNDDDWDISGSTAESEETSGDDSDAGDSDFYDSKSKKLNNKKSVQSKNSTKAAANSKTTKPQGKKQILKPKTSVNTVNFSSPKATMPSAVWHKPLNGTHNSIPSVKTPPSSKVIMHSAPSAGLPSCHKSPLGGVTIKSPYSGGIRLGLSKKARIKPLHSSVTVPH